MGDDMFNLDNDSSEVSKDEKNPTSRLSLLVVAGVAVIVLIVIALFNSMSVSVTDKKADDKPTSAVTSTASASGKESKDSDEGSKAAGEESKASDGGYGTSPSANPEDKVTLTKGSDPSVSGEYTAKGIVEKKTVLFSENQAFYTFSLNLRTDTGGNATVLYYVNKAAYDSAEVGNVYNVTYSGDSEGHITILKVESAS